MTEMELKNAGFLFQGLAFINLVAKEVMGRLQIGGAVLRAELSAAQKIKGMLPS